MSNAIFIAGYYRSGTSALAGALQRLGITLHNDAEPNEHNPLGFYEIPELIEFDVALFHHLGVDWTDLRGLPDGWWLRADMASHIAKLDEILRRRFATDPLWGLKHPHLCRLFPIYAQAARQAGHRLHAVHITRDPWSVAASQYRKNNLSRAHAVLLWIDYLISAERHTRDVPRCWLTYQDLLAKPAVQLQQIETSLGLEFCKHKPQGLMDAAASLTAALNRAQPVPDNDLFPPLRKLAAQLWEAVQARDEVANTWNGFAAARDELIGFLGEVGSSGASALPGFGMPISVQTLGQPESAILRPLERLDEAAKIRLHALRDTSPPLPSLSVYIAAPPNRAHAIAETLSALRAQWHVPEVIEIITADQADIAGETILQVGTDAGVITEALCAAMNAATTDYAAMINAGDTLALDACLRFALEAARSQADMIYCDELVPRDQGAWVRYKPNWDVTRLRQAAYIGDWVWYRTAKLSQIGGFNSAMAGVEEYDLQLRIAEFNANVVRLPETLFTRALHSRRDNIPSTIFGARAIAAVTAHLTRCELPALVQPRRYLGLFEHQRETIDPGTSFIILCNGADVPMLDRWLTELLSNSLLTGPVILTGTDMAPNTLRYLAEVNAKAATLEGKVLAVPPIPGLTEAEALRQALALAQGELAAIIEARSVAAMPDWSAALRRRFADTSVAMAAARTLVPLGKDHNRFSVQGPIIRGADTRLGAGHLADDPGPGGWLAVDQEASAVTPPGLLVRRTALVDCQFNNLSGDALWIDLCAQIRANGRRIVWVPDVSFIMHTNAIRPDYHAGFRTGSPAAKALPWADEYHHPALSLRGDLLAAEQRHGLVRAAPTDPISLLLSGPADAGAALLNAARGWRAAGRIEASWVGDHLLAAEIGRRGPSVWVRINPETPPPEHAMPYHAIYTEAPSQTAKAGIAAADKIFATSPSLAAKLRQLCQPGQRVELWRPALSQIIWQNLPTAMGLNTLPRILWIDENIAPAWWPELMQQTQTTLSWIVITRPGVSYGGAVACLAEPANEQGWAKELSALAPHIFVRPTGDSAESDHYKILMAAAAGCSLLVNERLDMPDTLPAIRLPNRITAWQHAIKLATHNLNATLERGAQTRAAALALAPVEGELAAWLDITPPNATSHAAE